MSFSKYLDIIIVLLIIIIIILIFIIVVYFFLKRKKIVGISDETKNCSKGTTDNYFTSAELKSSPSIKLVSKRSQLEDKVSNLMKEQSEKSQALNNC